MTATRSTSEAVTARNALLGAVRVFTARPTLTTSFQLLRRRRRKHTMTLRTRVDRLLNEVGVERTATIAEDVRALAAAVGVEFTTLPATVTALEAEVLGVPEAAAAPAAIMPTPKAPPPPPTPPTAAKAKPEPESEPAADSDSDGFELTGSQTEAERTAAAREHAERTHDVVDLDDDDDLAGMGVKALKAMAAARGVDLTGCCEKSEIVAALRAAPADDGPAAAPRPAPTPAAPPAPAPQSGKEKRLTRRIISSAHKKDASHYDVLGIDSDASAREITVAYRDIAALIHPDKCSEENASEAFKKVNDANSVLSDTALRSVYDTEQAAAAAPPPAPAPEPDSPKRRKRPKRKAAKKKKSSKKKRKAPSSDDDDGDSFLAESDDEEEEESEADSDSEEEEQESEEEDGSDVIGGSDDDDDEESDEESDEAPAPARCRTPAAAAPRRAARGRRPHRRPGSSNAAFPTRRCPAAGACAA